MRLNPFVEMNFSSANYCDVCGSEFNLMESAFVFDTNAQKNQFDMHVLAVINL